MTTVDTVVSDLRESLETALACGQTNAYQFGYLKASVEIAIRDLERLQQRETARV